MTKRGIKTRAGGKWTESRFWGHLRQYLRKAHRTWPPAQTARRACIVDYKYIPLIIRGDVQVYKRRTKDHKVGDVKTKKVPIYQCEHCKGRFDKIEMDHIIPCGSLKNEDDLKGFVERMFVEEDGYRGLCKECHKKVTQC